MLTRADDCLPPNSRVIGLYIQTLEQNVPSLRVLVHAETRRSQDLTVGSRFRIIIMIIIRIRMRRLCYSWSPKQRPTPLSIADSPTLPVQALKHLPLLHLLPPVPSTLDGGHHSVLRELGLQILQAQLKLLLDTQTSNLDMFRIMIRGRRGLDQEIGNSKVTGDSPPVYKWLDPQEAREGGS